jgi:hypothetical protein
VAVATDASLDGGAAICHVEGAVDAPTVAAVRPPLSADEKRFLLTLSRQTLVTYLGDGSMPPFEATTSCAAAAASASPRSRSRSRWPA